jgi:HK97 gp10 family phage protein
VSLTVQVDGLDDLLTALYELPKRATQKAVVRRSLTKAAEPMRGLASALAPYNAEDPAPHLRDSIVIGGSRRGGVIEKPGDVTVYVGPTRTGSHKHDVEMEFGTFKDQPQPYMRPAWEATKDRMLADLGFYMWTEIDGSAIRLAARAARLAG